MDFHKVAEIFPLMSDDEYAALKADIDKNGLREPLWTWQGEIIDGRNRYRVCDELGIVPATHEWDGNGSLVSFVVSLNLHRRHLSSSQKAAVAVEMLPLLEAEAKERQSHGQTAPGKTLSEKVQQASNGKAAQQAAAIVGTNAHYVADMKKLKQDEPALFDKVRDGGMTIPEAKKAVRRAERLRTETEQAEAASKSNGTLPCRIVMADIETHRLDEQYDWLITDPPYGILSESWEPDKLEQFTRGWLARVAPHVTKGCLIFWSQEHQWSGRRWFDEVLGAAGFSFRQLLVWHYPNNKSPQSRSMFKQTWEPVFFYAKPDADIVIEPPGGAWGDGMNDFDCHVAAVPQTNFNALDCKEHPAQKPVGVMRWLVGAVTRPTDSVLDTFAGSGTTGVACAQLGRRFLGIEKDKGYSEIAYRRVTSQI